MAEIAAFTAEHVCRLSGLSSRQLGYWDDTEFFSPTVLDGFRRRAFGRIYSFRDVVGLRTIAILRNVHRIPLQELRRVGAWLKERHVTRGQTCGSRCRARKCCSSIPSREWRSSRAVRGRKRWRSGSSRSRARCASAQRIRSASLRVIATSCTTQTLSRGRASQPPQSGTFIRPVIRRSTLYGSTRGLRPPTCKRPLNSNQRGIRQPDPLASAVSRCCCSLMKTSPCRSPAFSSGVATTYANVREVLLEGTPDPVIATIGDRLPAIVVTWDRDFETLAKRLPQAIARASGSAGSASGAT